MCNYSSKNKADYRKHLKTNKHRLALLDVNQMPQPSHSKATVVATVVASRKSSSNIQNKIEIKSRSKKIMTRDKYGHMLDPNGFSCSFCDDKFTRKDALRRHIRTCSKKILAEKDKEYQIELRKRDEEILRKNQALGKYEEELYYFKQILNLSENNNNNNVSAFNFINKTYTKAGPLQTLTYEEFAKANTIQYIDSDTMSYEDKLAQDLIYSHRHKMLGKYIGEVIVSLYHKDDPMEQSLWNTDISRLKYVVRLNSDNKDRWSADMNGDYTKKTLIEPVVDRAKDILMSYRNKYCDDKGKSLSFDMYGQRMKDSLSVLEIVRGIDNEKVQKEVLKYIAPHFNNNKFKIRDKSKKKHKNKSKSSR